MQLSKLAARLYVDGRLSGEVEGTARQARTLSFAVGCHLHEHQRISSIWMCDHAVDAWSDPTAVQSLAQCSYLMLANTLSGHTELARSGQRVSRNHIMATQPITGTAIEPHVVTCHYPKPLTAINLML